MTNQLPNGWLTIAVGEIADVVSGGTPTASDSSNFAEPGTDIAWLTPADLSSYKRKNISHGARDITQKGYNSSSAKLMPKGSILFSSRAPIGYVAIAENEISTNQGFKSFIFYGDVSSDYSYYYFRNIKDIAESLSSGTTFKELSGSAAKKLPFILCSFAEQKEIAARLDDLLAQVDTLKTRLDSIPNILKRFRQSVLAAAVSGKLTEEWRAIKSITSDSWKQIKISDIVASIDSGKNLKCIERSPMNDEYGIIKISAVTWGVYNEEESKTLPNARDFIKSKRVIEGDFLISRANTIDLLGSPVIVQCTTKNLMLSDKVWRLDISNDHKKWLWLYLKSIVGRKKIEERSTGNQMSMRNIGQSAFLSIEMLLPSLEEQTEIVRRVEELFAFADQVEQQVKAAQQRVNHLTQAILAKAFRGELTAQWREQHPDLISGENSAAALLARIKAEKKK